MKTFYLLISLIVVSNLNHCYAYSDSDSPVRETISKYDFKLEHTIQLKAKFGQDVLVEPADLAQLNGSKIHHIDLVYSAYTGSNSFSQDQLNLHRIKNLKKALPQVAKDEPTWKYIEQTGAKSLKEAKTYFHGFVVHFGPDLDYQHLKAFFKPFQTPPKTFTVNGKQGGTFDCGDGSSVNIVGNTVTYSDGTPVTGDFTLKYKEFKDPADIVFSGIPMTYDNGNEDLNFSSVGMYDLRADQNGKELSLSEPAEIDFNCTKPEPNVDFYQMDDATGEWTKERDVSYGEASETLKYTRKSELDFDGHYFELNSKVYSTYTDIHFDEASWDWVFKHLATYPKLNALVQQFNEQEKTAKTSVEPKELMDVVVEIMIDEKKAEMRRKMEEKIALQKQQQAEWEEKERKRLAEERAKMDSIRIANGKFENSLLAEGIDKGHTYPALVKGLNSADFGVYNCDQVYQLEQPLALSPTYVDENGVEITSKHVVCVMDLNFNGSFSFHPNNIKCSGVGKNVILLFTDDKSVFMLNDKQFAQLNLNGNLRPEFKMKNMTAVIKTSDDLKTYLKI
ncbi:MAG: hypothetical protein AB8B74_13750 [Crocinitomicaceae bacterium]